VVVAKRPNTHGIQESTADKLLKQKAEEAKKKQKEKDEARELDKEEFQKLLDEYYALDYEDIVRLLRFLLSL
jgi:hypothetical protein